MGYLGATLTKVFTSAGGADVSLRDITIAQMGNGAKECGWRHAPEACGGFWWFWKRQLVSWVLPREKTVDFRLLAEARPVALWRLPHVLVGRGGRLKIIRERLCISFPYVEEPLNSKVIKGFLPELWSRYVFFVFRDPYVLCIYIYEHSIYISHIHVWLCYNETGNNECSKLEEK